MKLRFSALLAIAALSATHCATQADVLIDDFNASRTYPECCGEYGAYGTFEGNVTQDGSSGTIQVLADAIDNGGFYRDNGGSSRRGLSLHLRRYSN